MINTKKTYLDELRKNWPSTRFTQTVETYWHVQNLNNQEKTDYFREVNDTYWGITWNDFVKVVKSYGFECGFQEKFSLTWAFELPEEEEIVFYHKAKGLILHAVSYKGRVDIAKIYGVFSAKQKKALKFLRKNLNFDYETACGDYLPFCLDAREGLCFQLNVISSFDGFSSIWTETDSYVFTRALVKNQSGFCKVLTMKTIKACSPEVQKIIFG